MRKKIRPETVFVFFIVLIGVLSCAYWIAVKYIFHTDIVHPAPTGKVVAQKIEKEHPDAGISLFSIESIDTKTSFELSKEVMDLEEKITDSEKKISVLEEKKKNIESKQIVLKNELHEEMTKNVFNGASWYDVFKILRAWKAKDEAIALIEEELSDLNNDIVLTDNKISQELIQKERLETERENIKTSLKQLNGALYEDVAYSLAEENIVNIKTNLIDGFLETDHAKQQAKKDASLNGLPDFIMPVHGPITSPFGYRTHPISGVRKFHSGVDIGLDYGDPVKASNYGLVIYAGWYSGFGNSVIISHGDGLYTLYAHNSELKVAKGDKVQQGQVIALGGSSGFSTGPHCHFSMWVNGELVDPMEYMSDR